MFHNRQEAALQLAEKLKGRKLRHPLVLAIPRGGVITGAILAQKLGADLDVVLSRKLHAPGQPELALGAVSEDGNIYLSRYAQEYPDLTEEYLSEERRQQLAEIERRKKIFRDVRPPAPIQGRSVIVTDDGIATGSTMIAALQTTRLQNPQEIIVAVPIVSPERIPEISRWCDDLVYLQAPEEFWAIGQFYEDFEQIPDDEVIALLRQVNALKGSHGTSRDPGEPVGRPSPSFGEPALIRPGRKSG
jgi:predicted phosphoribosyltransferase